MKLNEIKNLWTALGNENPMWAIMNDPACRQTPWTPDEFFETGKSQVKHMLQGFAGGGRALDFGCGIGRLTQALAEYFDSVDGVDISSSMIAEAQKLNRFPARVAYHLNVRNDLGLFSSSQYDFIDSVIVLQHMPAALQRNYIGEFLRLLKPGGAAFFQSVHTCGMRRLLPDWAVDFYRKLKYKNRAATYIPHYGIPVEDVRVIVERGGGTVVRYESAPYTSRPNRWRSDWFWVRKTG